MKPSIEDYAAIAKRAKELGLVHDYGKEEEKEEAAPFMRYPLNHFYIHQKGCGVKCGSCDILCPIWDSRGPLSLDGVYSLMKGTLTNAVIGWKLVDNYYLCQTCQKG